jgi:hypothetical protein
MSSKYNFPILSSGVTFPPMKISKILQKWPRIMEFGIFQHPHSNTLRIYLFPSWIISICYLITLSKSFTLIWTPANDLDPDLKKPLFCNFWQIQEEWTMPLSSNFVDLLYAEKNPYASSQYDLIWSSYGQNKKMAPIFLFFLNWWTILLMWKSPLSISNRNKSIPLICLYYPKCRPEHWSSTLLLGSWL